MSRARTALAWVVVLPWAAWAVVRAGGWEAGFPWVAMMAFTPYVIPLALASGLVAAVLRRPAPAVVAAATAVVLVVLVLPRVTGGADAAGGPALRVMTANLHRGDVPAERLEELVRRERVDVLALQELTPEAVAALDAAGLGAVLPHSVLRTHPGSAGSGIYARAPLREESTPAGTTMLPTAAALAHGGGTVQLLNVHAAAPLDPVGAGRWKRDLRALPAPRPGGPVELLAGDFNATLDHEEMRDLLDRGWRDAGEAVGAGLVPTWRGGARPWLTIDHVLAPAGRVGVRDVTVHRLPGSDHRAVVAELSLPGGR